VSSLTGKYGISTWVYPSLPVQEATGRLSGLGIHFVEYAFRNLVMSSTDPHLRREYLAGRNAWDLESDSIPAREIAEVSRSLQVEPIQMHAPDYNIAWPDQKRRRLAVNKTGIALEICRRLDVPTLVIHPGVGDPGLLGRSDVPYDRAREDNIMSIKELSRAAADLGVRIAIENRGQDIYGSRPEDLLEMVGLGPETLCACLDTGHANKLGLSPSGAIEDLGRTLGATHLHDNEGASDQHLPIFSGSIGWGEVIRSLSIVKYDEPLIAEIRGHEDQGIGDNRVLLTGLAMEHLGMAP